MSARRTKSFRSRSAKAVLFPRMDNEPSDFDRQRWLSVVIPVARELLIFLLFVALSVLMTWPLATQLDSAIREPGDPFFTTWAMDWDFYATFHRGVKLFDANIFFPTRNALALSEHMYGLAVLFFPLFA